MLLIPELKRLALLKQLFDLGILFEYLTDLKEIRQLYKRISKDEQSFEDEKNVANTLYNEVYLEGIKV